jgi:hypothetical protein
MFELLILFAAAMPFVVGMFAMKKMKKRNDTGSDDQPPPPDPSPPLPVLPPAPELRTVKRTLRREPSRVAHRRDRVRVPAWKPRVTSSGK